MQTECLLCGSVYYTRDWYRRHTHFCASCRQGRRLDHKREVYAEMALAADRIQSVSVDDEMIEYATRLGTSDRVVLDRQPEGWLTPQGSADGCSTFDPGLRGELHELSKRAAEHPWWPENPHWCAPLHVEMPEKPPVVACGGAKGTYSGYYRHVRARETACDSCRTALAEYFRTRRAA